MQAYKGTRKSNMYAPYSTCPVCGWSGRDWGFKYRNLCKRCHAQWRKEKAEERRSWKQPKPPNENMELSDGVVVTRNVRERFNKQARLDVPRTRRMSMSELCEDVILGLSLVALLLSWFALWLSPKSAPLPIACAVLGFLIARKCNSIHKEEDATRKRLLNSRLEELARERQRKIDETKAFYASSEWRLVREQVIQEQGRVCQKCRHRIADDYDLTVDHIKPRSKFPQLALDKSNLQVLCRRCNSAKGVTHDESSVVDIVDMAK